MKNSIVGLLLLSSLPAFAQSPSIGTIENRRTGDQIVVTCADEASGCEKVTFTLESEGADPVELNTVNAVSVADGLLMEIEGAKKQGLQPFEMTEWYFNIHNKYDYDPAPFFAIGAITFGFGFALIPVVPVVDAIVVTPINALVRTIRDAPKKAVRKAVVSALEGTQHTQVSNKKFRILQKMLRELK